MLRDLSLEERLNLTIPWIQHDGKWVRDSCHMYDLNDSNFDLKDRVGNSSGVIQCNEWEFDTSEFNGTIVEKVRHEVTCL